MHKCKYLATVFIVVLVQVCHFQNVSSATIATTTDGNTVTKALNNVTTNPIALEEVPRVEFNYSGQPFKEIEPAVLQYVGNDLERVSISCHLTSDKSAFIRWKHHGIEEWKVKTLKSLDDENGLDLDLSKGPPVIRMQCYYKKKTETLSNSILIYTKNDTSPYLYRRGDTIRAIALNQSTVHLPCILNYPLDKNIDGKKLQLFKDGKLVENDAFTYIPELGYHLNLKGLENPLGTYECRVFNSTNDVVFVELDNGTFINVEYKGHYEKFYAGAPFLQPFECKLPKDMYEYEFKWSYLWKDGRYTPLNVTDVTNSSDASNYMQRVKITFPETNIVGVVCASTIQDSESSYNNSYQVFVNQPYPPRILNQKDDKPIIYVSGMNLTCVTITDPVTFHWLKNGRELSNGEHIIENHSHLPYRSSIILNPTADDKDANYTCMVSNFLGNVMHDYRVQLASPEAPPAPTGFELKYLIIAAVILAVLVIMLGVFLTFFRIKVTPRELDPRLTDWFFKGNKATGIPYNEMEPYASVSYDYTNEIEYDKLNFVRELKGGNFGQVHFGWLRDIAAGTQIPVAIKQIKDDPTAPEQDLKHEFMSFLNEIKIMQCIGYHKHVVSYIGAVTSDINKYSAHLVVEYCSEGDLSSYLKKFRKSGGLFHDDIQGLHHNLQSGNQLKKGQVVLKTSHLMRWAQEMADGMHYIASKGIVHRDLAARNVLLGYQGINSDEYENVDPGKLIAKVSDFGLSRDLYENDDKDYYVVVFDKNQENNRQRRLPLRWLSIEALRTLRFTMKSDVWALGVTYWEMFTLGKDVPYAEEVIECDDMRRALIIFLESGGSLSEPEYAPRELWDIMLDCWQDNPTDRPDFDTIREILKATNESFVESDTSNRRINLYEQQPQLIAPGQDRIDPYSTVGIVESLGYNNMSYSVQSDLANDGDSMEDDEDESENSRRNGSNSPYQNGNIPNANPTPATYLTVGYVENMGYDNMEMGQYLYNGDIAGDDDEEGENGENSGHEKANNENDIQTNTRLTDQISAKG
ncbi:unnamed protein product [Orchesella dallaii]|uniref:Receptor protein-tyrosine kinase n=1 Tax=Orchesella dallaii TaxID=48710 RepID=A0ABP1Q4R1_9HEXA